jgi:hypothetical protein
MRARCLRRAPRLHPFLVMKRQHIRDQFGVNRRSSSGVRDALTSALHRGGHRSSDRPANTFSSSQYLVDQLGPVARVQPLVDPAV